jgi:hypothetical protein
MGYGKHLLPASLAQFCYTAPLLIYVIINLMETESGAINALVYLQSFDGLGYPNDSASSAHWRFAGGVR